MGEGKHFWFIIAQTHVWKEVGWNTIIYLAAITSINPSLYEAASIDGAGRFKKMRYITLPGIKSTIVILLIMNIGRAMDMGFELQYLLYNEPVKKFAEVIETFVLRYGLSRGNYSFATAAGMFKSVIAIILVVGANKLAKALGEEGIM
jgi:putative aldouronate transport system permease protein